MRTMWWIAITCLGAHAGCASTDETGGADAAAGNSDAGVVQGGPDAAINVEGVRLPFAVDDYFIPSGYMGDGETGGIERTEQCANPRPGDAVGLCHRFTWTPGDAGWAGVFWQFPEGSWGEEPGLTIAPGAMAVSFWAWGAAGGEKIEFVVGMDDVDGFNAELDDVELTTTPTRYTIDLTGVDYTDVTGGFAWVASMAQQPTSFYLDSVQWQ